MVPSLRRMIAVAFTSRPGLACGMLLAAAICVAAAAPVEAQQPAVHFWHHGAMPPGAIAAVQLDRGGPVPGYFQPVEVTAPPGATISLAEGGAFGEPMAAPVRAGLLIGPVYRMRVMNIPFYQGLEVFPTIELIDRLYTPRGQEIRFPVVIELTQEDLALALDGKFVTRVIYLEDPDKALPVAQVGDEQSWFEAGPGRDPLAIADELGRPVAILRLGARLPATSEGFDSGFLYGSPPLVKFPPRAAFTSPAPAEALPQGPNQAPPPDAVRAMIKKKPGAASTPELPARPDKVLQSTSPVSPPQASGNGRVAALPWATK